MTVCVCACACAYIFLFPALIAGSQFVKKQNKKKLQKPKTFSFPLFTLFVFYFDEVTSLDFDYKKLEASKSMRTAQSQCLA